MIVNAGAAEVIFSSVYSLHLTQRRAPLSCPRARVWLRRHRHSLAEVAVEEGLEAAVDALNAVSHARGGMLAVSLFACVVVLWGVWIVVAMMRRRGGS